MTEHYEVLSDSTKRDAYNRENGFGQTHSSYEHSTGGFNFYSQGRYNQSSNTNSSYQRGTDSSSQSRSQSSSGGPFRVSTGMHNNDIVYDGDIIITGGMVNSDVTSRKGNVIIQGGVLSGDVRADRGNITVTGGMVNGDVYAPNGKVEHQGGQITGDVYSSSGRSPGSSNTRSSGANNFDSSSFSFSGGSFSVGAGNSMNINGVQMSTDGKIMMSGHSTTIQGASYIDIVKVGQTLRAVSLGGRNNMTMEGGIICGGSVKVNEVTVGSGTVDLGRDPRTQSFVRR